MIGSLYNPLTAEAWRLFIEPPQVVRMSGTVTDLDREDFILTLTPDGGGDDIELLVPNKPRVVTVDGDTTASFHSLRVFDRVDNVTYRYTDNVVVDIIATTR